jgi:hypothetical protein
VPERSIPPAVQGTSNTELPRSIGQRSTKPMTILTNRRLPWLRNTQITVYFKGELVYGTEPSSGARLATEEAGATLQVRLLGNPVQGDAAEIEILGAENQLVQLQLINTTGTPEADRQISRASAVERYAFPVGKTPGLYLLRVSIPAASVVIKVVKQ